MTYKISNTFPKDWFAERVASKPIILFSICASILIIGFFLSYLDISKLAFQRSGSVLVIVAIISVYFNHYYSSEIANIEGLGKENFLKGEPENLAKIMKKSIPGMTDQKALSNAIGVFNLYNANKERLPLLTTAKKNIVAIEFMAGILGTFFWGFGDIPFLKC